MVALTTPEVHLLAATQMEEVALSEFLNSVGVPFWETDAATGAEALMEVAGRLCYKSFAVGLNPNVTRVREGNHAYLGNILKQQHGSVLEHATVTFAFLGVSRVFTHELVRHRTGTAYSQESLRFVRLDALTAFYPEIGFGEGTMATLWDSLPEDERSTYQVAGVSRDAWAADRARKLRDEFVSAFEEAEARQRRISEMLHLDLSGSFAAKKKVTSAMRRLVPDGISTAIITTANHRTLRDIIARRTHRSAEEEIRLVYAEVFHQLKNRFPAVYQDSRVTQVDGLSEVVFENMRV